MSTTYRAWVAVRDGHCYVTSLSGTSSPHPRQGPRLTASPPSGEGSRLNSSARSPWAWRTRSTSGIRKGSVFVMWRLRFDFKGDFQWCDILAWLGRIKKDFSKAKKKKMGKNFKDE